MVLYWRLWKFFICKLDWTTKSPGLQPTVTCHLSVRVRGVFFYLSSPVGNNFVISISKFTLLKVCIDPPRGRKSTREQACVEERRFNRNQSLTPLGDTQCLLTHLWGHLTFFSEVVILAKYLGKTTHSSLSRKLSPCGCQSLRLGLY